MSRRLRGRRFVQSIFCRLGLEPHRFRFWMALHDGAELRVVERCNRQPWCRAVRSYVSQPTIPESWMSELVAIARAPLPFGAKRAGTAVTAPPAPPATAPAVSAPPPDPLYVEEIGVDESSPFAVAAAWSEYVSSIGARARTDSSTSTPTRLAGSPRSHEVS